MIGIGLASVPNFSAGELDHLRHTIEIRSTEVFQSRKAEFGLMVLSHTTRRSVLAVPENEDDLPTVKVIEEGKEEDGSQDIKIHPYKSGYGVYGVFAYQFVAAGPQF